MWTAVGWISLEDCGAYEEPDRVTALGDSDLGLEQRLERGAGALHGALSCRGGGGQPCVLWGKHLKNCSLCHQQEGTGLGPCCASHCPHLASLGRLGAELCGWWQRALDWILELLFGVLSHLPPSRPFPAQQWSILRDRPA